MAEEHTERTLTVIRECHVYTLPPRPNASGYKCQDWPKTNHIFTGRVRVVAQGDRCTVRLEDPDSGTLFAQCPLDNDRPEVSVEPVTDSSRYFVLRVVDQGGRHAFLGMGFKERNDAFDLNVTLQDHVKQLRVERESEAAAAAPAAPPQDFSLKGNIEINIGAPKSAKPRPAPPTGAMGGLSLAPPPPGSSGGKRPTSRPVAAPAASAAPIPVVAGIPVPAPTAAPAANPFGTDPFGSDPFGSDPFAALGGPPAPAPAPAGGEWKPFG